MAHCCPTRVKVPWGGMLSQQTTTPHEINVFQSPTQPPSFRDQGAWDSAIFLPRYLIALLLNKNTHPPPHLTSLPCHF